MKIFERYAVWYTRNGYLEWIASRHWTKRGASLFAARLNHRARLQLNEAYTVRRLTRADSA